MIVAIVIMGIVIAALFIFILMLNSMVGSTNKHLEAIEREQYEQDKEIIKLMQNHKQHQEMLLQHIEILKYLIEQDPKLNSGKMYFTGPVGEA
jgi:Na+-transporting methylmalonyl-CoA/oxaloacetate decarboxylase gamma subunit